MTWRGPILCCPLGSQRGKTHTAVGGCCIGTLLIVPKRRVARFPLNPESSSTTPRPIRIWRWSTASGFPVSSAPNARCRCTRTWMCTDGRLQRICGCSKWSNLSTIWRMARLARLAKRPRNAIGMKVATQEHYFKFFVNINFWFESANLFKKLFHKLKLYKRKIHSLHQI